MKYAYILLGKSGRQIGSSAMLYKTHKSADRAGRSAMNAEHLAWGFRVVPVGHAASGYHYERP